MLGYFKLLTIIQVSHDWQRTEPKMQVGQKTENVPENRKCANVFTCRLCWVVLSIFIYKGGTFFCSYWNSRWQPCWFTCYQEHKKVGLRMLALFLSLIQTTGHKMAALMFFVTFKCWFVTTRKRNQATTKNLIFLQISLLLIQTAKLLRFSCPSFIQLYYAFSEHRNDPHTARLAKQRWHHL